MRAGTNGPQKGSRDNIDLDPCSSSTCSTAGIHHSDRAYPGHLGMHVAWFVPLPFCFGFVAFLALLHTFPARERATSGPSPGFGARHGNLGLMWAFPCISHCSNGAWSPSVNSFRDPFESPSCSLTSVWLVIADASRWCGWPTHGLRIGEASHPGPAQQLLLSTFFPQTTCPTRPTPPPRRRPRPPTPGHICDIAVLNPTSILHKAALVSRVGAHILCVSETSAVARAQQIEGVALRRLGYTSRWGHPVAPHTRDGQAHDTLRGLASGVAILSSLPSRPSVTPLPAEPYQAGRLCESFIRIGAMEVRFLAVYGTPANNPKARELNQTLLQTAFDRATANRIPCVIAGDFNTDPLALPAGELFRARGYREAFELAYAQTGLELPPTRKGATRHDTMLLHPALVALWDSASVLVHCHLFDAHAPLVVRLHTPQQLPCLHRWTLPKPWAQYNPDPALLASQCETRCPAVIAQAERCQTVDDVDKCFRSWSQTIEHAVDACLSRQHSEDPIAQPQLGLL